MSRIEQLLDAEADKQAEIDDMVESNTARAREMFSDLLFNIENRDPDLWEDAGLDLDVTIADYEEYPVFERDHEWKAGFETLVKAARLQTWLEIYAPDMLELAEREGQKIETIAKPMSRGDMVKAAKQGVGRARFKAAGKRRKNDRQEIQPV